MSQWKMVRWYAPNGNLDREKSFRCIYTALASATLWAAGRHDNDSTVRDGKVLVWGTFREMPGYDPTREGGRNP